MNKNIMSSTSTDVNANVNPVYADAVKVDLMDNHSDDSEMVKFLGIWLSPKSVMEYLQL